MKTKSNKIALIVVIAFALALVFALVACNPTDPAGDDITGVTFADKIVTYNGTNQTIAVTGDVPEGVTVAYTLGEAAFSGATNAGEYEVTATLSGTGFNNLVLNATLTINKADINPASITFASKTVEFDNTNQTLTATGNPTGTSIAYTIGNAAFAGATATGSYNVTATISGANYNTLALTRTLNIVPSNSNMKFWFGLNPTWFKATEYFWEFGSNLDGANALRELVENSGFEFKSGDIVNDPSGDGEIYITLCAEGTWVEIGFWSEDGYKWAYFEPVDDDAAEAIFGIIAAEHGAPNGGEFEWVFDFATDVDQMIAALELRNFFFERQIEWPLGGACSDCSFSCCPVIDAVTVLLSFGKTWGEVTIFVTDADEDVVEMRFEFVAGGKAWLEDGMLKWNEFEGAETYYIAIMPVGGCCCDAIFADMLNVAEFDLAKFLAAAGLDQGDEFFIEIKAYDSDADYIACFARFFFTAE
jgi:hypothetical protein